MNLLNKLSYIGILLLPITSVFSAPLSHNFMNADDFAQALQAENPSGKTALGNLRLKNPRESESSLSQQEKSSSER